MPPTTTRCRTIRLNKGNASALRRGVLGYLRHVTSARPFFSIVMASYLGEYGGRYGKSAENREHKFFRAIDSVLAQGFREWELLIVSDGCDRTNELMRGYLFERVADPDPRVRILRIVKQRLWSEKVRNAGIHKARGQYVLYLDTDDRWGANHLQKVHAGLQEANLPLWAHMDDLVYETALDEWQLRTSRINTPGGSGTSNIVHAGAQAIYWPPIKFRWPENGYDHDRQFIRYLFDYHGEPAYIGAGEYMVCHIPRKYDL